MSSTRGQPGGPPGRGDLEGLRESGGPSLVGGQRGGAVRSTLVALASTVVFFGAVAWIVVSSPGWPAVQESFLNGEVFAASFPSIVRAFWVNVQLFLIAEVLILALGLVIAVLRSLPGPVFFPVRLLTTVYVDVFRALPGVPIEPFFYAVVALTLVYSAYVSEVYRAGIESVHPSQEAAARSLGLSRFQALRHVILPQAVRRVIPPLLNDFIGLQKDTVLVSYIGVVEIFRQSYIQQAGNFNFTPYMVTALVFVVVTLPLARLTDWLIARDKRRQAAGGIR